MANYYDEQEESPLGTVLSNIPNQIMSIMQMKKASEQQALQAETIRLQQDKLRQQVEQQDKLLGRDRAGYDNQVLNKYFTDLLHSPIDIRPGEEGWSVDTGIPLPSSFTVIVPSELIFTLIFLQYPARASSIELSTTSYTM